MAITHDEWVEIDKKIRESEKNQDIKNEAKFVLIEDCNDKQTKVNEKFANDDKRIDRMLLLQENTTKSLQKNNWLTTAILTVIIGVVVTMILKSIGVF